MTNNEKAEILRRKLNELNGFKSKLSADNLEDFNSLKREILDLLDDNQKLRLNQISFYREVQEYNNNNIDDLPF